ncbi:hypothetical protein PLEOSDRAFT_1033831, partial [Pleurotus ostreatus PC15]
VFKLVALIVAWCSLRARVSRDAANTILKSFKFVLTVILQLLHVALQSAGVVLEPLRNLDIPSDIRTIYVQAGLDIDIIRITCCPKCFKQYPSSGPIPHYCTWKRSPRSRACNEELYTYQELKDGPKRTPRCLYTTQSLQSWITVLLSRSGIDRALHASFAQFQANLPHDRMRDIQDSPAWQSLRNFLQSPYHLIFGMYVDWFNPFTNKIAGKVASCGAIVLYCLSLPLEIRFLPENVYILGIMPGPHAPDTWTISHVLETVQTTIMEFDLPGKLLPTYSYPNGASVAARIIPLIADLQAIKKVAEVHQQAMNWKNTVTVTDKHKLAEETGVRWTPMHDLPYWNPVKHVTLGFMHNFLEGILQYQLRVLWGTGRTKASMKALIGGIEDDAATETSEDNQDASTKDDTNSQHGSTAGLTDDFNRMDVDDYAMDLFPADVQDDDDHTPTTASFPPCLHPDLQDTPDSDDDSEVETGSFDIYTIPSNQLEAIRGCIHDVLLPTWVQRPPSNLGDASHGKLKAHELLVLFSVIFPLVLPELWWAVGEHEEKLLESFCHLIQSTNIIASYSVTPTEADMYTSHYTRYRASLHELYPGFSSVPNHHYAMHNGDLLKFWGPLSVLSEFPGERMNGDLGQINTNRKLGMFVFLDLYLYCLLTTSIDRLYGINHVTSDKP